MLERVCVEAQNAVLQDTNDYILSEHSKGRHVLRGAARAGGEITPEKLIVIGEVAKKFGPIPRSPADSASIVWRAGASTALIWRELIDAALSRPRYGKHCDREVVCGLNVVPLRCQTASALR